MIGFRCGAHFEIASRKSGDFLSRHRLTELLSNLLIAPLFELAGQFRSAGFHDTAVVEDVDEVRSDVVQQSLVMRDHQYTELGTDQAVDSIRNHAQSVDVQARVCLVLYGDFRLEHRHL